MPSIKKLFLRLRTDGNPEKDGPFSPTSKQRKFTTIQSRSEDRLLDGKYEDIQSATDANFKQGSVLQLQLDLSRDLNIEDVVDDESLAERKLKPDEALRLMRACAPIIVSRGLETLGVMHPHWHSASPVAQRKIISLFLRTLDLATQDAAKNKLAATSAFEAELEYSHSPHDVAAVFRWALRHLVLDGASFGNEIKVGFPFAWYDNFVMQEREQSFSRTAFNDLLVPSVKGSHAALLKSTLDLASSLASHSEINGMSGSKLSMSLGHYLLTGNRVESLTDWPSFYAQWERAGRALEHIFLAFLRNEEARFGVPRRLAELIANYPYATYISNEPFARPGRFATRLYDALYVQITSEIHTGAKVSEEQRSPLQLLESSLKAEFGEVEVEEEAITLWEQFKLSTTNTEDSDASPEKMFSKAFSDDTIRLLTLRKPRESSGDTAKSVPGVSMSANGNGAISSTSLPQDLSGQVSLKSNEASQNPITTDWGLFSSSGFGETGAGQSLAATLLDADVEKTDPPRNMLRRSSLRKSRSRSRRRVSPAFPALEQISTSPPPSSEPISTKITNLSHVKLDEAFVDFWSDALLDSVTAAWPAFVVCQLRSKGSQQNSETSGKVEWLIVEQKFSEQRSHAPQYVDEPLSPTRRASSPRPSSRSTEDRTGIVGRVSSTFSVASRRRLNLFGASTTDNREKLSKGVGQINEMGVAISEEGQAIPRSDPEKVKKKGLSLKDKRLSFISNGISIGGGLKSAPAAKNENPKEQVGAYETRTAAQTSIQDTCTKTDIEHKVSKPEVADLSSSAKPSAPAETILTSVAHAPEPVFEFIPEAAIEELDPPTVAKTASGLESGANGAEAAIAKAVPALETGDGAGAPEPSTEEEVDSVPHTVSRQEEPALESTMVVMSSGGPTSSAVDISTSGVAEAAPLPVNEKIGNGSSGDAPTPDGDKADDVVQQFGVDEVSAVESQKESAIPVPVPSGKATAIVDEERPPSVGHTSLTQDTSVAEGVTESPAAPTPDADTTGHPDEQDA